MIATGFDQAKRGFHFRNGTFTFHVGPFVSHVLCGGISYAALDYYYSGLRIPDVSASPVEGHPLESYLYDRQATAHFYTWHRFAGVWSGGLPVINIATRAIFGSQGNIGDFLDYLEARKPVVLCLYGDVFSGHHVLAVGADTSRQSIELYDSNFPDMKPTLTKGSGGWVHSISNKTWRGWFADWGFYHDGVKTPPLSWRFCSRCNQLITTSFGAGGACAAGGTHSLHPRSEYFLPHKPGDGMQRRWWACERCLGLFSDADPLLKRTCAGGGTHVAKVIRKQAPELFVRFGGGPGESDWRQCKQCSAMFWQGPGSSGKCPEGGAHVPENDGKNYSLDNRAT